MNARFQLSLYVPPPAAAELEAIRRLVDPVQASLIPAHVTLCREEELEELGAAEIRSRLAATEAIMLRFGASERFFEHGIRLPCTGGEDSFHLLRQKVLASTDIRQHAAHITLAHPRNPRAPENSLANAASLAPGLAIAFHEACLIRQVGMAAPWQIVERFVLGG